VTVAGGIETGKTLSVTKSGTGTGTVVSEPAGITCGSDCAETYNTPVFVTLTATADMGSIFTGWAGGGCGGTGTCAVAMDATKAITATFADIPPTGTITIDGGVEFTGSSTVTLNLNASDSNGISQMQFSGNNSDWSAPEPFSATKNWTLSPGDGLKTVWVKFQDNQGSWSEIYSYSISLDTRLPVTTATPPGGSYETAQLITLAADESATIYYTTDGTEPTESSTVYALPIPVGSSLTLKFFAKDLAGNKEQMKEAFYVIQSLLGANAGPDQLVFNQVVLDASGSTGAIVSYQWQLTHRTNPAYSRVATGIRPVLSNLSAGFYDVVLTVVGETGSSASEMTLAVVPENVVTDVRAGWFNQQQLDQAVNNANTAKDAIIAQKEQTITTLNTMISSKDQTIASMFTEQQLNQAVAEERIKWDVNNDGKIGLPEAIYILQKVAGAR
jgi:hypothetical protein